MSQVQLNEKYQALFKDPSRYFVVTGGRNHTPSKSAPTINFSFNNQPDDTTIDITPEEDESSTTE